jgi:DNA-binding NarL/FixJ family response regulator
MSPPYRIVLADDHLLLRQAIKNSIEDVPGLKVVGEVSDGLELLEFLKTTITDMTILDISMPRLQGIEAAREIKGRYPQVKIIILTMHKSKFHLREAVVAGVDGYLIKEDALADLISAINTIREGRNYFSSRVSRQMVEDIRRKPRSRPDASGELLSPREIEILTLIAEGNSSKEIADLLSISIMTVYNHRINIKNKLNIKRNAELVKYAIQKGYTSSEINLSLRGD